MISFNKIGHMGRLGNQMFQYAALKGIAANKNYWYSVSKNNDLINCFKIPSTLGNYNVRTIINHKFEFDQSFFDTCPDDIDISGYFQTEKYFKHIEDEIRKDFTFNDIILEQSLNYKNKIISNAPIISLHVRRGDYLTDTKFEVLSLNYYFNALKILPRFPVIIFSDDISWCKEKFIGENFIFSSLENQFLDLCLMSLCDYHIIANSSFSWWGSWLAKSKQTIAPKKWFSGEFYNLNTKDLYQSNWIII